MDLIGESTQTTVSYPLDSPPNLSTFAQPFQIIPWLYFINLYHLL